VKRVSKLKGVGRELQNVETRGSGRHWMAQGFQKRAVVPFP